MHSLNRCLWCLCVFCVLSYVGWPGYTSPQKWSYSVFENEINTSVENQQSYKYCNKTWKRLEIHIFILVGRFRVYQFCVIVSFQDMWRNQCTPSDAVVWQRLIIIMHSGQQLDQTVRIDWLVYDVFTMYPALGTWLLYCSCKMIHLSYNILFPWNIMKNKTLTITE